MIPFLENLILKDFWLKLFSLALAGLIYFTVNIAIKNDISPVASLSLSPTEQLMIRELPIVVLTSADEMRGFTIAPKTADVTLQGDAASLRNLRKQEIRVVVDLSDPGALQGSRRKIEVSTPAGISHVRVDPQEVQVTPTPKN
jgi:YbbR domain-containing protein